MVAESKRRLATNNIFITLWCHYLLQNIGFCDSGCIILYPQPRSATHGYPSFTEHLKKSS